MAQETRNPMAANQPLPNWKGQVSRARQEGDFYGMVGRSEVMRRVYRRIERFAKSDVPVLLEGETGTGKEMAARALCQIWSPRRPLVTVNCAAISSELVESELFGHEKGAFTGALRRHEGLIAQADGGILFLDEIAELSTAVQAKLLRAIESGGFRSVGAERSSRSDFRLIAATNRDLEAMAHRREFRSDLLYRLGAARIHLPPLRARLSHLPSLLLSILSSYRARNADQGPRSASHHVLSWLGLQQWPGNVRELRNVLEALASLCTSDRIELEHVAELEHSKSEFAAMDAPMPTLEEAVRKARLDILAEALRRSNGERTSAARLLGISRATLYRHLPELGSEFLDAGASQS